MPERLRLIRNRANTNFMRDNLYPNVAFDLTQVEPCGKRKAVVDEAVRQAYCQHAELELIREGKIPSV